MITKNQAMKIIREPAVSGLFYDEDPLKLRAQIALLFDDLPEINFPTGLRGLILPHAGYIYSGRVAAAGISLIEPNSGFKRIFLIGSSHRMGFDGASIYRGTAFRTPLGEVPVDISTGEQLAMSSPFFAFNPMAHDKEHALEVQLPLLQYHLDHQFEIVPILIGTRDPATCQEMAQVLKPWFTPENLFIISTDFSHYPAYDDAVATDKETAEAILKNNPDSLLSTLERHKSKHIEGLTTSLCGWSAVLTMLYITTTCNNIAFENVLYENSGDTPLGDKSSVVGYHAIVAVEKQPADFSLSVADKKELLIRAKASITSFFEDTATDDLPDSQNPVLQKPAGAFVSLYKAGKLAGCIGHIGEDEPLWRVVDRCARAAAFDDNRFKPLQQKELTDTTIEISVLTPPVKINSIEEIIPGKHGIIVKGELGQGTFLPQVAERMNWDRLEMLRRCARDKAGIGVDGWKNAEIYIYEAIVIKEES